MPTVLATLKLAHNSGSGRDTDDIDFVFDGEQSTALDLANDLDTNTCIQHFINNGPVGTTHTIAEYLGNSIDRGTSRALIEYYDITTHLSGSAHGSPVKSTHFTVSGTPVSANDAPAQAAAVITLHGSLWASSPVESGSTRPKSRHSGRLYIGTLVRDTIAQVSGEARWSSTFVTDLTLVAGQLRADVLGITTPTTWDVWSRVNAATDEIVGGFVDNSIDVQRKRKIAYSSKVAWS